MVQSKEVMERNIHAYDEDVKWQLAEPGALMSAKAYRDKKALPLVEKLKEVVKKSDCQMRTAYGAGQEADRQSGRATKTD